MGRLTALILAVSALVFPTVGNAAAIMGAGAHPCSMWTKWRALDWNDSLRANVEGWALGYMSGVSYSNDSQALRGATPEPIFKAIDERCSLKPNELTADALLAVLKRMD